MLNILDNTKYTKIFLKDYCVETSIGVNDYEKIKKQRLLINVEIYILRYNTISLNDSINDIVDYDFILKNITKIIDKMHINLQETLCSLILQNMLEHPKVEACNVSTEKIDIYHNCKSIGVELFEIKSKNKEDEK